MLEEFELQPLVIHVWRINLELDQAICQEMVQSLDDQELTRANRYRHMQARQQFIAGRAQLRQILGAFINTPASQIQFDTGQYGKPRLAGTECDQGLVFNLSHSGNMGLVAVAADCALGVDIEKVNSRHNLQALAERCFAQSELDNWSASHPGQQAPLFYNYWCAKEAFLKATGRGLALGMQQCSVDIEQCCFLSLPELYHVSEWQLFSLPVRYSYRAYIATNLLNARLIDHNIWTPLS